MAITYVLLNTIDITGSTSNVTYNSIPQTYTDLHIRLTARNGNASGTNNADAIFMYANGDNSTNNWSWVAGYNNDTSATNITNDNYFNLQGYYNSQSNTTVSNTYALGEWYICDYTNSSAKPILYTGNTVNNVAALMNTSYGASLYRGGAITSLTFQGVYTAMQTGTVISIYGITKS